MVEFRQVVDRLGVLRGMIVQGVRVRDRDSLILELVDPSSGNRWGVRVYSVAWRIESDRDVCVGVDDNALSDAVRILNGQALERINLELPSLDTTFIFADYTLRIFPVTAWVSERSWQQWSLRTPTGQILSIGPGKSWSVKGHRT